LGEGLAAEVDDDDAALAFFVLARIAAGAAALTIFVLIFARQRKLELRPGVFLLLPFALAKLLDDEGI
jgi:hypothetical protein